MITANAVAEHFGIPKSTLYYLVKRELVRYHELPPKEWVKRRQLRFTIGEVREDLAKYRAQVEALRPSPTP